MLLKGNIDPTATDLQDDLKSFCKKLWNLNLTTKQKITVWKISWNFLPTLANLHYKRLGLNTMCLRCGGDVERIEHVFYKCPVSLEVWNFLNFMWIVSVPNLYNRKWLT